MRKAPILIVAAAFAGSAQEPQGQAPQSVAGVVRLNRAPVSTEVLKVKLPRPVERQLPNGLKLLVVESHRVPTVTLRIDLPAGSLHEPENLQGLADATAALIRLGTKTRTAKDMADQLAELGASLSVGAGQGEATIYVSSLTESLDATLALLADVLLNPTFPEDELNKWKDRQRAQLEQAKASPGFLANDLQMRLLYPNDRRRFTHPTSEGLANITRDKIVEFYQGHYTSSGEWAGIAGDITPREAVAKLEKALGKWKGRPVAQVKMPLPEAIKEKKVYLIPRPNSVQTYLVLTNHAIDRKSPDYIDVQLMNRVLGSGPSSRLFRVIREQKGYTYGVGSGFIASRYLNHFTASTSVRTEVTEPALEELLKQFSDIRDRAVPADELADAKSAIVAGFVLQLESPVGVLSRWIEQRREGLAEDYWDTYTQKVGAVTAEDVQRVAKKYVPLDNVQMVAVGDASKVGELLKKFGPVEVVDGN